MTEEKNLKELQDRVDRRVQAVKEVIEMYGLATKAESIVKMLSRSGETTVQAGGFSFSYREGQYPTGPFIAIMKLDELVGEEEILMRLHGDIVHKFHDGEWVHKIANIEAKVQEDRLIEFASKKALVLEKRLRDLAPIWDVE